MTPSKIDFEEALERGTELYLEEEITGEPYQRAEKLLRRYAKSHGMDYADYLQQVPTDDDNEEIIESFEDFKTELRRLRRHLEQ